MRIVNSVDRRLKENPGASLKRTAWSISFNHQRKLVEILHTQRWWDLWVHQSPLPFISFPYPTQPVFVFYRPRAAQVRVKARAGWCFCERDNRVNDPKDLVHLTSNAYKSTNSRRPQRSQKGKWGWRGWREPHSLYFYGQERGVWGPYKVRVRSQTPVVMGSNRGPTRRAVTSERTRCRGGAH